MFVRKLVGVVAAAGLLVSLSACSGAATAASCTPVYATGSNASLVTADGPLGADPKAEFPTPLVATTHPQSAITEAGDGRLVAPGDTATIQITIYDGKTGDTLISTDYTGTGLRLLAVKGSPAFGALAECAKAGSRVAAVGTAGDLIGQGAIDQNQALGGLTLTDTVVMIVDVTQSFLGRANGADQLPQAGLPSIALAPNGQPGFTFPAGPAPQDLKIATLKAGKGAAVKQGDSVVLNYTGVLWADKKTVFDSTWDRNAPATLTAVSLENDQNGVVPGFAKAIIGAKVGSQVLVVIPPKDGYPSGSAPSSVPDGSTMVFVIDILGIDDK
ncbi:FKBP-type peptidyl-prolyl cis-trans isomerase [soil metagenome]